MKSDGKITSYQHCRGILISLNITALDQIAGSLRCTHQAAHDAYSANVANLANLHTLNPFQFKLILSYLYVNSVYVLDINQ